MRIYPLKFMAFFGGCLCCYVLQRHGDLSAVTASALTGLAASFLFNNRNLQSAIYAGTFAGMCSASVLQNFTHVILISSVGTAVYLLMRPHFIGVGGKLGTISFISSLLFFMVKSVW